MVNKFVSVAILGILLISLVSAVNVNSNAGANANVDAGINADIKVESKTDATADADENTVISVNGERVKTKLEVSEETQARVRLSNGQNAEIKVMPNTASETAIARLRLNVCTEENNCTIELREVRANNEVRAAYRVEAEKQYKVFGLFKAKANVNSDVDAETGEVLSTSKPWWASLSSEVQGDAATEISSDA